MSLGYIRVKDVTIYNSWTMTLYNKHAGLVNAMISNI
jgi:hypothetical protein